MPIYTFSCPCGKEWEGYIASSSSNNPSCACGATPERVWGFSVRHIAANGFPFTTTNVSPDGRPETFSSQSELDRVCKERGLVQRDDAAWVSQQYLGVDMRTGQQRYKEGNGVGLPGCWV